MRIGAEPVPGGVRFRVWAPRRRSVEVVLEDSRPLRLEAETNGYFSGVVESARPGSLYRFRLYRGDRLFPDPASRFQPEGPHGPSQVMNAASFAWSDHDWKGLGIEGQVLYEMHIGTFTPDGTWQAAEQVLPELEDVGITVLEIMPVA